MGISKEAALAAVKAAKWNIQGFNGYPLYLYTAATEAGWMTGQAFGAGYTHFFYLFSRGRVQMFYDEEDWKRIGEGYFARVKDSAALAARITRYDDDYAAHVAAVPPHVSLLSLQDAIVLARKLSTQLVYALSYAHGIEGITYVSEHRLRAALEAKGRFDEMTFSKLCAPTKPSFLHEARVELAKIREASDTRKEALVKDFLTKYAWIENTYQGQAAFTEETVLRRADELKSDPEAHEFEIIAKEKEALVRDLGLTPDERFIVETIDVCFDWQDRRKHRILETIGLLDGVMNRIAALLAMDPVALKCILPEEFALVESEPFQAELMRRKEGSALYVVPEASAFFTGADFDFFTSALHIEFGNDIAEFRGVPASRGVVSGTARVCESVSDIARVQEGEILVASMTRPEYLPAMQRAAAFVTDEGGVTCHAAIVAREMKKPCVIGTRIATRAVKDGDIVEVDADKGVVRITKRAE